MLRKLQSLILALLITSTASASWIRRSLTGKMISSVHEHCSDGTGDR
jgi:hypothetical protein